MNLGFYSVKQKEVIIIENKKILIFKVPVDKNGRAFFNYTDTCNFVECIQKFIEMIIK